MSPPFRAAAIRIAFLAILAPTVDGFGYGSCVLCRNIQLPCNRRRNSIQTVKHEINSNGALRASRMHSSTSYRKTRFHMVRNVDLPEALVFYGMESIFDPPINDDRDNSPEKNAENIVRLRPGIARLLDECREVGTVALILSEVDCLNEKQLKGYFAKAWDNSYKDSSNKQGLQKLIECNNPVLSFRCINSKFTTPPSDDETLDAAYEFYNILSTGRSPSPAFLIDSLQSIRIDPRAFGGSSGFGRGQWIEPRRSPMATRTVVFVAGDWEVQDGGMMNKVPWLSNDDKEHCVPLVKDRCAAVRAAGCRVIYLENLQPNTFIQDNSPAISLCDAVISTYGNDNPRDIQPITLDAISTPGDYWLNPPSSRDDAGNAVSVEEVVEWFRAEREMEEAVGDLGCVVREDEEDDQMSEDEMNRILADLDGL